MGGSTFQNSSINTFWKIRSFDRCCPDMAHIRQSKPDSGLGFQAEAPKTFRVVPSSPDSGWGPKPEESGHSNVQRFRGGLVSRAHNILYHSTLGLRVVKKKRNRAEDQNLRNRDEDRVGGFGDQRLKKAHDCGRRPCLPQYQEISSISR